MTTIAVVPLQRLSEAKSRLSERLSPADREKLALHLLHHVVDTLQAARSIDRIIVVSPDPVVLAEAESHGAIPLVQPDAGLNRAVELGRLEVGRLGADTLMVVLGDLPLLTPGIVDELLQQADAPVTIAPDRHGQGTNILVLHPPNAIDPAFGTNSYSAHRHAAAVRGRRVREYRALEIGFDVDTEQDLDDLGRLTHDSAWWRSIAMKRGVPSGSWE